MVNRDRRLIFVIGTGSILFENDLQGYTKCI